MAPGLLAGDQVLVNKMVFAPTRSKLEQALLPMRPVERGDVVLFSMPNEPERTLVKRCLGVPGDRVALVDKQLQVNGAAVAESYVKHVDQNVYPASRFLHPTLRQRDNMAQLEVPPDHLFCLGDNRDVSHDSRYLGPVPESHVQGRPLLVYWSEPGPSEETNGGERPRWNRILEMIR